MASTSEAAFKLAANSAGGFGLDRKRKLIPPLLLLLGGDRPRHPNKSQKDTSFVLMAAFGRFLKALANSFFVWKRLQGELCTSNDQTNQTRAAMVLFHF